MDSNDPKSRLQKAMSYFDNEAGFEAMKARDSEREAGRYFTRGMKGFTDILGIGNRSNEHGYGMGLKGAIKASRLDHAASFVTNTVGLGAAENMLNTLGIITEAQRKQFRMGGLLSKATIAGIPALALGTNLARMYNGDDPSDIIADNLAFGGSMIGFNAGKSIGGMLSRPGATISRTLKMGGFGAAGMLAGGAAVSLAYDTIKDLSRGDSKIADFARSIYHRSDSYLMQDSRQSLTARARALQKLSANSMNDRAMTLGNESLVLKGVM